MRDEDRAERETFLADCVIHAIEGNVTTSWAEVQEYEWYISILSDPDMMPPSPNGGDNARVVLVGQSNLFVQLEVTPVTIGKAFRQMHFSGKGDVPSDCIPGGVTAAWRERVLDARRRNDATDIDAIDADMLVQLGLFGEVRY